MGHTSSYNGTSSICHYIVLYQIISDEIKLNLGPGSLPTGNTSDMHSYAELQVGSEYKTRLPRTFHLNLNINLHYIYTPSTVQMSPPIIIIGAGAFGLSTALHLSQNVPPQDILVLEQDEQMPPRRSAANDLNKIVRAEYEDPFYTELTLVLFPSSVSFVSLSAPHTIPGSPHPPPT